MKIYYVKNFFVGVIGVLLALTACIQVIPATPNPHLDELLIDISAFPEEWTSAYGPQSPGTAPLGGHKYIAGTSIQFDAPNGVATETILQFASLLGAVEEFERQLEISFPKNEFWEPWTSPVEITFSGPSADSYYVACSSTGKEICKMIAQYGEYYVKFSAHILPVFSYADFENVLVAIEEKMGP